ncbi:MAG: tetratricopeptide repeat protein [Nitrospirota bacterium]
MSLEDIERLKERVNRDPYSKLFVPLAEEYKKAGMLDEAIAVLIKGIERQPGYMSARVSLGKVYLEKGMPDEARVEFENVVSAIPDNLYAHRKLAEIYRDLGEKDKAVEEFKIVLRLNPLDEEAARNLADLKRKFTVQPPQVSLSESDFCISQGRYMEAMDMYRRLLSIEPGNMRVLQRVEELKALLKLLGKDKEKLIARLNSFLDSIKKRRDEILQNP